MSEIKINNIPVITENNGSVELTTGTADIGNVNVGNINVSSSNHTWTLKGIDTPIGDSQTGTAPDTTDNDSGQLAIYNGATKLWGITEHGYQTNPNMPCISGRLGGASSFVSPAKILFEQFWIGQGITYDSNTRRFTVPIEGFYRITMNPFFKNGVSNGRVLIGVNNDAPNQTTCFGHCYRESATYDTACLNSVVNLSAGDYIVYYLYQGELYNANNDRFNDFSIQFLA